MQTEAVVMKAPRELSLESLALVPAGPDDVIVEVNHSAISTGTEKLLWSGEMPPFPGMGYPLVPGYEATGEVVEAAPGSGFRAGDRVFVPGATCFGEVRGLFGSAARRIATRPDRLVLLDSGMGAEGALLALAATARHAIADEQSGPPDLIVGHGTLGRLLARLTLAQGAPAPTVWETEPARRDGAEGYGVLDAESDPRRDYRRIYDATGKPALLDSLVMRLVKGGEIVLAGFYAQPVSFAFPPAFMKEARFRIAAEWTADDMAATANLIASGALSLDGLITHCARVSDAPAAYRTAFTDPACLKMILDWSDIA